MTPEAPPFARFLAFALSHADEPEGQQLADALLSGRPLDAALGLAPDHQRRDALLRELFRSCFANVSLRAASTVIAQDFWTYRTRVWPGRRARLVLEPREPLAPVAFYSRLCAEGLAVPSPRQIMRILAPCVIRPVPSGAVEMAHAPDAASAHEHPPRASARPCLQPAWAAARHHRRSRPGAP